MVVGSYCKSLLNFYSSNKCNNTYYTNLHLHNKQFPDVGMLDGVSYSS